VHGTISTREQEGIMRPDMIQLLMQARKGTLQVDNNGTNNGKITKPSMYDKAYTIYFLKSHFILDLY
jgi:hypothetical protein